MGHGTGQLSYGSHGLHVHVTASEASEKWAYPID